MCGIVGYTVSAKRKTYSSMALNGSNTAATTRQASPSSRTASHGGRAPRGEGERPCAEVEPVDTDAPAASATRVGQRTAARARRTRILTPPATAIAVVHNGIIENFAELREELEGRGHRFTSETDTEVIAHLIVEVTRDLPQTQQRATQPAAGRARGDNAWWAHMPSPR